MTRTLKQNVFCYLRMPACHMILMVFPIFFGSDVFWLGLGNDALAGEAKAVSSENGTKPDPSRLWEMAQLAREGNEEEKAAGLLLRIQKDHPKSAWGEKALFLASRIHEGLAMQTKDPDWRFARELYQMFLVAYPESPQLPDAYLGIVRAYINMRLYRDALRYCDQILRRFPASPVISQTNYWKAYSLAQTGKFDEARGIYETLTAVSDQQLRIKAALGIAEVEYLRGAYDAALVVLEKILKDVPSGYLEFPDIFRKLGMNYLKLKQEARGREYLFRYWNLENFPRDKTEVLFELAESFLREGNLPTAHTLYGLTLEMGKGGDKNDSYVIKSRFRLAALQSNSDEKSPAKKKYLHPDSVEGDIPYQNVITYFYRESIAQEARYGLLLRCMNRKEYDNVYDLGRSYLRVAAKDDTKREAVQQIMGQVLVSRVEELLAKNAEKEIYRIYVEEHDIVSAYKQGRLFYLMGRALQGLILYDEAAKAYLRALDLPLAEEDKADLFMRRVDLSFAKKDLRTAQELLKQLRKMDQAKPYLGRIYYLTARVQEEEKSFKDAMDSYAKALGAETDPQKKASYAEARMELLVSLGKLSELGVQLGQVKEEKLISPDQLQKWYLRLGDSYRAASRLPEAIEVYSLAIGEGMPEQGDIAQAVQLHLGDVYLQTGKEEKAQAHFEKALSPANTLLAKMAEQRLQGLAIKRSTKQVEMVLHPKRN